MRHSARRATQVLGIRDQPKARLHRLVAHRLLENATAAYGIVHSGYPSLEG
jgi:hypothetical protein